MGMWMDMWICQITTLIELKVTKTFKQMDEIKWAKNLTLVLMLGFFNVY